MMYNNTKVQISVPFHEDLFLQTYLATEMWPEDYYEFLSIIGLSENVTNMQTMPGMSGKCKLSCQVM